MDHITRARMDHLREMKGDVEPKLARQRVKEYYLRETQHKEESDHWRKAMEESQCTKYSHLLPEAMAERQGALSVRQSAVALQDEHLKCMQEQRHQALRALEDRRAALAKERAEMDREDRAFYLLSNNHAQEWSRYIEPALASYEHKEHLDALHRRTCVRQRQVKQMQRAWVAGQARMRAGITAPQEEPSSSPDPSP